MQKQSAICLDKIEMGNKLIQQLENNMTGSEIVRSKGNISQEMTLEKYFKDAKMYVLSSMPPLLYSLTNSVN